MKKDPEHRQPQHLANPDYNANSATLTSPDLEDSPCCTQSPPPQKPTLKNPFAWKNYTTPHTTVKQKKSKPSMKYKHCPLLNNT